MMMPDTGHLAKKKAKNQSPTNLNILSQTANCNTLIKLGATREEVMETLGMAVYMGGGPSLMYAAEAIAAFDELS